MSGLARLIRLSAQTLSIAKFTGGPNICPGFPIFTTPGALIIFNVPPYCGCAAAVVVVGALVAVVAGVVVGVEIVVVA